MILRRELADQVQKLDDALFGGHHHPHGVHVRAELDLKELVSQI